MAIHYIRPIIKNGTRIYRVYDQNGQPMTDENTRAAAMVFISEITNSEADVCIGTLGGIFSVESHMTDADPSR